MEKLMKKNLQAALMYNFFLDNMDKTNALIISYDAMEELFGKSRTTLWRYISFLVDEKVIEVHTTGQSNIYCINASLAWAQTEELKRFARFNASVVISEKEAKDMNPDYFLVTPWAFIKEFVKREKNWLRGGGKFIVPFPKLKIIKNNA